MTVDKAKEYLKQIKYINDEVESLKSEREQLESSLVSSIPMKEDVVTSSPKEQYDDKIIHIVEYRHEINKKISELMELKREASKMIDKVDDRLHRIVLRKRYIGGYSWNEIGDDLHYSYRQVQRCHGEALVEFRKVYNMAQNGI